MAMNTPGKHAGTRAGAPIIKRGSKLDLMRLVAADIIHRHAMAGDNERLKLFIQLRSVQDHISVMKHRSPPDADKASSLAWVDMWRPQAA